MQCPHVPLKIRVDDVRAAARLRRLPKRIPGFKFNDVRIRNQLLKKDQRQSFPCPYAHLQTQLFNEHHVLDNGFTHRLNGQRDEVDASVRELSKDFLVGTMHLQLSFDFQFGACARGFDNIQSSARHGKLHIDAVPHFNVNPVCPALLQILHLRPERRIVRPEQASGDFNAAGGIADSRRSHLNPSEILDFESKQ